jgi:hypothetical protein
MKPVAIAAVFLLGAALAPAGQAEAGCLKGAVVGGLAGHFLHHGVVGAGIGCAIGHHESKKHRRERARAEHFARGEQNTR